MILKASAENGAESSAGRSSSSMPLTSMPVIGGRSTGLGRKSTTASSMGCTPLFLNADPHSTGTTWLAMVPARSALRRSSAVISSSPTYFSRMFSSNVDSTSTS